MFRISLLLFVVNAMEEKYENLKELNELLENDNRDLREANERLLDLNELLEDNNRDLREANQRLLDLNEKARAQVRSEREIFRKKISKLETDNQTLRLVNAKVCENLRQLKSESMEIAKGKDTLRESLEESIISEELKENENKVLEYVNASMRENLAKCKSKNSEIEKEKDALHREKEIYLKESVAREAEWKKKIKALNDENGKLKDEYLEKELRDEEELTTLRSELMESSSREQEYKTKITEMIEVESNLKKCNSEMQAELSNLHKDKAHLKEIYKKRFRFALELNSIEWFGLRRDHADCKNEMGYTLEQLEKKNWFPF